uniref:Uncharacterized protein n=1 Tax=Cacopsylla melanoneura TaxID=428564 RepID=A0A8D8Z672_9HEMI
MTVATPRAPFLASMNLHGVHLLVGPWLIKLGFNLHGIHLLVGPWLIKLGFNLHGVHLLVGPWLIKLGFNLHGVHLLVGPWLIKLGFKIEYLSMGDREVLRWTSGLKRRWSNIRCTYVRAVRGRGFYARISNVDR